MMADVAETGWESLREVRIDFANPDPDSVEPFDWNDTVFSSLGGEYKLNESFTLRAGVAYDETPTHIETRTPRLPDDDRSWYSIGATWKATEALESRTSPTPASSRTRRRSTSPRAVRRWSVRSTVTPTCTAFRRSTSSDRRYPAATKKPRFGGAFF